MRNPFASLSKLPNASEAGRHLRERLESALDKFPSFVRDVDGVLRGEAMSPPPDGLVEAARGAILDLAGERADEGTIGLQPSIFDAYRRLSGDPDEHLATWLREGAPLGINRPVLSAGIFPPVPDEPVSSDYVAGLARTPTGWENYRSADDDSATATTLLERMVDQGWAEAHSHWDEVTRSLGDGVVLNKLALLSKTKSDGTVKHRLVWDLRRSGVNLAVKQGERVVLPRLSDVVADLRELAAPGNDEAFLLGTDVSEAFHQVPLHPSERQYTVAALGGRYYVFKVLVFGSSSAPTVWGRYAAFLGRSTAAVVGADPLRLQVYVDDPLYVCVAQLSRAARLFSVALLWALVLGYPLAWHKTEGGHDLRWIGAQITLHPDSVRIRIPEDRVAELLGSTVEFLQGSVVGVRRLRTYAGVLSFFAGMVPLFRPFLASIWAALPGTNADGVLTVRLVHTKRIRRALLWFRAFLSGVQGSLERTYPLKPESVSRRFHVVTDASPWGIGGVLYFRGSPVSHFSDQLHDEDLKRFRARRGDPAFNTLWEALAILVALRCWSPLFTIGTAVTVRSDSHGSLSAMAKLSSPSPSLNLVMAELALDASGMVCGLTPVDQLVHIPGVSNTVADPLSRMFSPSPLAFPAVLACSVPATPPFRDVTFWRTRLDPLRRSKTALKPSASR